MANNILDLLNVIALIILGIGTLILCVSGLIAQKFPQRAAGR